MSHLGIVEHEHITNSITTVNVKGDTWTGFLTNYDFTYLGLFLQLGLELALGLVLELGLRLGLC
jgi:hypothetical protein